MKIIGGILKNRNFYMPFGIRPTQNLLRKAVFDLLGEEIEDKTFIDFFAGSGAMGFEALSRGAKSVVLIEREEKNVQIIQENAELLLSKTSQPLGKLEVIEAEAFATIKDFSRQKKAFDIVFIDPPYGRGYAKKALKTIGAYDILHSTSWLIVQTEKGERLPETEAQLKLERQKKYGTSSLSIYRKKFNN